ncbi:MAG TPA: hypothetical protein VHJ17_09320 [Thermomonospora sp.]|nr:hypothetical protein [Thermomonospora sp.]
MSARSVAGAHRRTISVLDRRGLPPATADAEVVYFIPLDGGDWYFAELTDGTATGDLPAGNYIVQVRVRTPEADGSRSSTLVFLPDHTVDGDAGLVLDARRAVRLSASVDRADARPTGGVALLEQKVGGQAIGLAMMDLNDYVTPAAAPGLAFGVQAQFTRNGATNGSPYVYNLAWTFPGIPDDLSLKARTSELAAVRVRYGTQGLSACGGTHQGALFGGLSVHLYTELGALPATRTEYYTPGVEWSLDHGITTPDCDFGWENTDMTNRRTRFPRPGSYTLRWNTAPFGPAASTAGWNPGADPGGEPDLFVPMLSSWGTRSQIGPYAHMTGSTVLRNARGEVVATTDLPGTGDIMVQPEAGTHTLTVDAHRRAPWSDLAVRQHVRWTFTARGTRDERPPLPVVRHRTALDDRNRARRGTTQTIVMAAEGLPTGAEVRRLTLAASYDDGTTWTNITVRRSGEYWIADLPNSGGAYVSLRTTLADSQGGAVEQTVIRAYGLK